MFGFKKKQERNNRKIEVITENFSIQLPINFIENRLGYDEVTSEVKETLDIAPYISDERCYLFQKDKLNIIIESIPKALEDENVDVSGIFEKRFNKYRFDNKEEVIDAEVYNVKRGKRLNGKILIYHWESLEKYNYVLLENKNISEEDEEEIKEIIRSFKDKPVVVEPEKTRELIETIEIADIKIEAPDNAEVNYFEGDDELEISICDNEYYRIILNIDFDSDFFKESNNIEKIQYYNNLIEIKLVKEVGEIKIYDCRRYIGERLVYISSSKNVNGEEIGVYIIVENTRYNEELHGYLLEMINSVEGV